MSVSKETICDKIDQLRAERALLAGERRIRGEMGTLGPGRPDKLLRKMKENDAAVAVLEELVSEGGS